MKKTLQKELNILLPNSDIETIYGKFYMRFELGGEGNTDGLKRIEQATFRGLQIFEELIGNDELLIVIEEWEQEMFDLDNLHKPYIYQILGNINLKRISGPFEQTYYEIDEDGNKHERVSDEPTECDLIIGKAKLTMKQIQSIIKGIASLEIGEKPCVPQRVSFFAIEKQAGFNIYDDRGCDIWANSLEILRPIYHKLNSWILDYNRPIIDQMFKDE